MDLTRKKQVVKWQTSPVGVLNCDTAVLIRFLEHLGLVLVLKVERLVSVLRVWESRTSRSWGFNVLVLSRSWEFDKMERLGLVSVLWLNILWTSLACGHVIFHQIYNLGAVEDKDELIRFWGQRVRGNGHSETDTVKKHLFKDALFWRRCTSWRLTVEKHLICLVQTSQVSA